MSRRPRMSLADAGVARFFLKIPRRTLFSVDRAGKTLQSTGIPRFEHCGMASVGIADLSFGSRSRRWPSRPARCGGAVLFLRDVSESLLFPRSFAKGRHDEEHSLSASGEAPGLYPHRTIG